MTTGARTANEALEAGVLTSRSPRELAWRRFKKNKVGIAALCTSLFFVLAAVFAPLVAWLVNVDPNERDTAALTARGETIGRFGGMSWNHPLGVEPGIGYDILARLIYGARISIPCSSDCNSGLNFNWPADWHSLWLFQRENR